MRIFAFVMIDLPDEIRREGRKGYRVSDGVTEVLAGFN